MQLLQFYDKNLEVFRGVFGQIASKMVLGNKNWPLTLRDHRQNYVNTRVNSIITAIFKLSYRCIHYIFAFQNFDMPITSLVATIKSSRAQVLGRPIRIRIIWKPLPEHFILAIQRLPDLYTALLWTLLKALPAINKINVRLITA